MCDKVYILWAGVHCSAANYSLIAKQGVCKSGKQNTISIWNFIYFTTLIHFNTK